MENIFLKLSIQEIIVPLIVTPHCLSIAILAIIRLKSIKQKKESIIFIILCIATGTWSLSPLINPYIREYGWITGMCIAFTAIIYTLIITFPKMIKFMLIYIFLTTIFLSFFLIKGDAKLPSFTLKFALTIFTLTIFMNIILYIYFIKHKTKFHLLLGIMSSIMIIGGIYQSLSTLFKWIAVPAATLGSLGFVFVIGYFLIIRGYLHQHGWKDYVLELEEKEKLLNEKYSLLKKASIDSVTVLSQTIEAKDPYTRGHCLRVRNFSKEIGKIFKLDKQQLVFLEFASLLHDIGKIGVPGVILNKNGKLTEKEFSIIKKHPEIGADILSNVNYYKPIIPIIRHHHEFFNGEGYPDNLKEEKIPFEARILSVCDVYDAMTSDRPYRKAFPQEKALSILNSIAGTQLDPIIVKVFILNKIYKIKHYITLKFDF